MPYGDGQFTGVQAEQQDMSRAGIRVATEFITGLKPQGTTSDPFPLSAIQAAIEDLPTTGGEVFLPAGIWAGATQLAWSVPVRLRGAGRNATTIDYTGTSDAIHITTSAAEGSGISDLTLDRPTSGAGHGIRVDSTDWVTVERVSCTGGSPNTFAITYEDSFQPAVRDVEINAVTDSDGLGFINTATGGAFNFGNGTVSNIFITVAGSGIGCHIRGDTTGGSNIYNLLTFNYLSVQTGAPGTTKGILMENASLCSFVGANLEGLAQGIEINGGINGGAAAGSSTFVGTYMATCTAGVLFNSAGRRNCFVGGQVENSIVDNNSNQAQPNIFVGVFRFQTDAPPAYEGFTGRTEFGLTFIKTTTGAPTDGTYGAVDGIMVVNTFDDRLYIRTGGSWLSVVLA